MAAIGKFTPPAFRPEPMRTPKLSPPLVPLSLNPGNAAPVIQKAQANPTQRGAYVRKVTLPSYGFSFHK